MAPTLRKKDTGWHNLLAPMIPRGEKQQPAYGILALVVIGTARSDRQPPILSL